MKAMFKVEIYKEKHDWHMFVFKFETLEEAQNFIESAITHFSKEEDDENMEIKLHYSQKFSTEKEGKKETLDEEKDKENK